MTDQAAFAFGIATSNALLSIVTAIAATKAPWLWGIPLVCAVFAGVEVGIGLGHLA